MSGGSIVASYYAMFGDEKFERFKRDFLLANLIRQAFSRSNMYHLWSVARQILGHAVLNQEGEPIGRVQDVGIGATPASSFAR